MVQTKTMTISKLMEIAPKGVADPTPFIYDSTMYTMAGLALVASVSHYLIRPVDPKYFEVDSATAPTKADTKV